MQQLAGVHLLLSTCSKLIQVLQYNAHNTMHVTMAGSVQNRHSMACKLHVNTFPRSNRGLLAVLWCDACFCMLGAALQGLMQWDPSASGAGGLAIVSNRVSKSSEKQAGHPIRFANSVVVSPATSKIYFTSSTDIPPPYAKAAVYDTMRSAQLTHLTVRLEFACCAVDPQLHGEHKAEALKRSLLCLCTAFARLPRAVVSEMLQALTLMTGIAHEQDSATGCMRTGSLSVRAGQDVPFWNES